MIAASAALVVNVSVLLGLLLMADGLMARRRPLAMSALWNAALVAALVLVPATWLLPRWELPLLPADIVVTPASAVLPAAPAGARAELEETGFEDSAQHAAHRSSDIRPNAVTAPLAASEETSHRPSLAALPFAIYAGGLALSLVRLTMSLRAVSRLRRDAKPLEEPGWKSRFTIWRKGTAARCHVALLESSEIAVPIVLGWRRPAIVIPCDLAQQNDAATIDAVLVHEFAHIERADCGWQLVERVVQAVYWFHPLAWLASRRIAQIRERACDDFAVHQLHDKDGYAEILLAIAARANSSRSLGLAMAVVRTSSLERRLAAIERSEGQSRCRIGRSARWGLLASLLLGVVCGSTAKLVRAQATEARPPAKESVSKEAPDPVKPPTIIPAVAAQIPKWQQELATQFSVLVQEGKFDQLAAMFSPRFRELWPPEHLKSLFDAIAVQFGTLRSAASLHTERVGNTELTAMMCAWGKQAFSVRLSFNDGKQIDGIWFAQHWALDPIHAEKAKFQFAHKTYTLSADELLLGETMVQLAKATLSLVVNAVQANGEPFTDDALVTFYRALDAGESPEPNDWRDTTVGITWRFFSNESRQVNRADRLLPGTYRALFVAGTKTGYQLSDPIKLDGSQQLTTVELRTKPTATLIVRVVDAQTGEGLQHFDLRVLADGSGLPSYQTGSSDFESPARFEGLLPGRHRITAFRNADKPGERDYEQEESPQFVNLEAGKTTEVTVKLRAKPTTREKTAQRWPFVVTGRVVDADGKPVEGAVLSAYSGYGTLHETGSTTSDVDGRYTLRFGRGFQLDDSDSTMESSAIIRVSKPGLYNRDRSQGNHLTLVNKLPAEEKRKDRTFVLPSEPHELNVVLAPAVGVSAEFEDPAGGRLVGETVWLLANLPRLQETVASGKTSAEGWFKTDGVAPRQSCNWSLPGDGFPIRSNRFEFSAPGNYHMVLQLRQDADTGARFLKIKQVIDSDGKDVTPAVVQDDPVMREPLPAELQTACQEIVAKLLAANRLWLAAPPAEVKTYQFDVHFDAVDKDYKPQVTYQVDSPDSINPQSRHGITYTSPLHALGDRANVVFRALEIKPERTVLAYTFKKPVRIAAGNGVDHYWRGSINAGSREGIVVIDSKRNVPLEVQGDVLHEYFENYREVAAGEFVPQRIRIDLTNETGSFGWGFDWRFTIYQPQLWMLSESRDARTPAAPPVMTLDNVQVNGEPARRLE